MLDLVRTLINYRIDRREKTNCVRSYDICVETGVLPKKIVSVGCIGKIAESFVVFVNV